MHDNILKCADNFLKKASGKLIIVDIQPEYSSYIPFNIVDVLNYADKFNEILILFNGPDLGMNSEEELKSWYWQNIDYDEEKSNSLNDKMTFFEKGYGFFRNFMDEDVDYYEIIKIVKYMMNNGINDLRELTDEQVELLGIKLNIEDNMINIPDLAEILPQWSGAAIIGGGKDECLAEVMILANALDIDINEDDSYIY